MSVSVGWPHVDRLVAAGMAVRDEDGLLWLTGAGHAAADRLFTARREGLRDLLAGWTPEQHAELAELLNTLSRVMTESYRGAASMTQSYPKAANLLGAFALAVADEIREATQQADGLATSEPAALVTLAHYPGQSVGARARTLSLTHSGAVRLADRLVAAGLVRRANPGPGRTLALLLTESGQLAAARVLARRRVAVERLVSRLLTGLTTDRASAQRLCRLCDEPLCDRWRGCPVDRAAVS